YALGRGVDDSLVCLVGYKPGDIVGCEVVAFGNLCSCLCHVGDGEFENGGTFLIHVMLTLGHGLGRSRETASSRLHVQVTLTISVTPHQRVDNANIFG